MTTPATESLQQVAEQNRITRAIELEDVIQNPEPPKPVLPEEIATRAERGWDLHLTKRQLITRIGEDTYTVPASNGGTHSTLRRRGRGLRMRRLLRAPRRDRLQAPDGSRPALRGPQTPEVFVLRWVCHDHCRGRWPGT